MKCRGSYLAWVAVLVLALAACMPRVAPLPSGQSSSGGAGAKATPGANDAAWQKIVQDAKKEGKVVVYSFNLTSDVGTAVAKAFKQAYGIDMEVVVGPGAQLVERVRSERRGGQYAVDVMDGSAPIVIQLKQEGSTVPIGDLPALREQGVWRLPPLVDKDGNLMMWIPTIYVPYYNTTLLKATDVPKSWQDFLSPNWKGKIAIANPDTVPALNRLYVIMTTRGVLTPSYFSDLTKQDIKFYPTARDDIAATARGEVSLNLSNNMETTNPLIKQGAPLKPFDIPQGVTAAGAVLAQIKNAPHPNAAQVYLNWLQTKEGQAIVHEAIGSAALRTDVPDFTPPEAKVNLTKVLAETESDIIEEARMQSERVLGKMFAR